MPAFVRLALLLLATLLPVLGLPVHASADASFVRQRVQPSQTGPGIAAALLPGSYHHVAVPSLATQRKNVLVVFLGGSTSSPGDYTLVTDESAKLGFGTINLSYPNGLLVGTACGGNDACFTSLRGETIYGQGVSYPGSSGSFSSAATNVSRQASVVNRLVSLLHFLRTQPANPQSNPAPAYWSQFLVAAPGSPYVVGGAGALPDWSKIILAGHSQGGGHAAFLGVTLPSAVRRVVMFSAPNDHVVANSASWIFRRAATPTSRFWGLRSENEGILGDFVALNWQNLEVGGLGPAAIERNVGTGKLAPVGSQRLVLLAAGSSSLTNHNSTVADGSYNTVHATLTEDRNTAWHYLLTGAGAD